MILSLSPASPQAAASGLMLGAASALALLGYAFAALPAERFAAGGRLALWLGWAAHAAAIVVDVAGIGSPIGGARFGFAPALSMTIWLVLAVYVIESRLLPLPGVRRALALLGIVVVALAWRFPGELRPQADAPWAPLHWALGLASYGLFGAAVLHAVMLNRAERQMRNAMREPKAAAAVVNGTAGGAGLPLLRLEGLTFRFVLAGFVVLTAALLLGAWFANPWRWDHKTVFSVLGWAVFAALLGGRRLFGWRRPAATRWLYAGAGLLLLAYVGSRFVLEVILHRAPPA